MKKKICVWLLSTVLVAEIIGTCGGNAVNVLAALSGSTLENELEQYDQEAERQLNDEEDESGEIDYDFQISESSPGMSLIQVTIHLMYVIRRISENFRISRTILR